jgi:hypothetical protein
VKIIEYSFIGFLSQKKSQTLQISMFISYKLQSNLNEALVVGSNLDKIQGNWQVSPEPLVLHQLGIRGTSSFDSKTDRSYNTTRAKPVYFFNIKETYSVPSDGKLTTVESLTITIFLLSSYTCHPFKRESYRKIKDFNEINFGCGRGKGLFLMGL